MEIKKLEKTFICDCGKKFLTNAGLWKHNKKCNNSDVNVVNNENILLEIVKSNQEFKQQILDICKIVFLLSIRFKRLKGLLIRSVLINVTLLFLNFFRYS